MPTIQHGDPTVTLTHPPFFRVLLRSARLTSKSTVDVDQRYVSAVDGAVSRGAARFGCGRFAVHPDRGGGSPCRVGWAQLVVGDTRQLVLSRCRGRAFRAAHRGQFGAGFPLCDGHPR